MSNIVLWYYINLLRPGRILKWHKSDFKRSWREHSNWTRLDWFNMRKADKKIKKGE